MSFFPFSPPLPLVFKYAPPCSTFWAVKKLFFFFQGNVCFLLVYVLVPRRLENVPQRPPAHPSYSLLLCWRTFRVKQFGTLGMAGKRIKWSQSQFVKFVFVELFWLGQSFSDDLAPILLKFVFVFLLRDFASGFFFPPLWSNWRFKSRSRMTWVNLNFKKSHILPTTQAHLVLANVFVLFFVFFGWATGPLLSSWHLNVWNFSFQLRGGKMLFDWQRKNLISIKWHS